MASILVIDHDASSARALRYLLDGDGHRTQSFAFDGGGVSALVREPFDLVIANVDARIDADHVLRHLRRVSSSHCVFAMTARDARHEIARVHAAGACAVFKKPIDYTELADAITHVHACAKGGHRHFRVR